MSCASERRLPPRLQRENGVSVRPGIRDPGHHRRHARDPRRHHGLLNDGDEVLLPDPVYDAYTSPILLAGGRVRPVRADVHDGRFVVTAAAIEAALTPASRVLLLNTPWNPVGTVFRAIRAARRSPTSSSAATSCSSATRSTRRSPTTAPRHVSPASLSTEARARTVIVNSLSKTYAMTGWRVGYCAAPAPIIQAMLLVLQQSSRGPATFVQDAAAVALSGPQQCVEDMRLEYARRRRRGDECTRRRAARARDAAGRRVLRDGRRP